MLQVRRDAGQLARALQGGGPVAQLVVDVDEHAPRFVIAPTRIAANDRLQQRHRLLGVAQVAVTLRDQVQALAVVRLARHHRLQVRQRLGVRPRLDQARAQLELVGHGRQLLDAVAQLGQRRRAVEEVAQVAEQAGAALDVLGLVDEEIGPRPDRLEGDDDPEPRTVYAALVGVGEHPDRHRRLQQVQGRQLVQVGEIGHGHTTADCFSAMVALGAANAKGNPAGDALTPPARPRRGGRPPGSGGCRRPGGNSDRSRPAA